MKRRSSNRFLSLACMATALFAAFWLSTRPAVAQGLSGGQGGGAIDNSLRIVAIVNDDVITARDINTRIQITLATTGLPNTPDVRRALREQVLRKLVDERLYMQESKKRGINPPQEEIDRYIAFIEKQSNVPPGRFEDFAARSGFSAEAYLDQVKAEMTWGRMVRARLNATNPITERDVDEAVQRIRNTVGQTEELLAEILIPVDSADQEDAARKTAEDITKQIRDGGTFPNLARQFSRGVTAAAGGDMGWVQRGVLPDDIEVVVEKLERGQITNPIRSTGGYYIYLLRDRRKVALPGPEDSRVTLNQIVLALPANARPAEVDSTVTLARQVREMVSSCSDVEALAKELKAQGSGSLGTLKIGDMPENIRNAVVDLKKDETSQPVTTPRGVLLFTVCDREDKANEIDTTQVRQNLMQQRMALMAQRYIQDLRRDATIEFR